MEFQYIDQLKLSSSRSLPETVTRPHVKCFRGSQKNEHEEEEGVSFGGETNVKAATWEERGGVGRRKKTQGGVERATMVGGGSGLTEDWSGLSGIGLFAWVRSCSRIGDLEKGVKMVSIQVSTVVSLPKGFLWGKRKRGKKNMIKQTSSEINKIKKYKYQNEKHSSQAARMFEKRVVKHVAKDGDWKRDCELFCTDGWARNRYQTIVEEESDWL